jgi:hypothetical protein
MGQTSDPRGLNCCVGDGVVTAREVARNVILIRLNGYFDETELVERFESWFSTLLPRNVPLRLFWDAEDVLGYRSVARARLQLWQYRFAPMIGSSVVLVRSRLCAVTFAVATLTAGGLHKALCDRQKFETLLDESIWHASQPSAQPWPG